MLQQLPFEECMDLLLPVLRKKVLTVTNSPKAMCMVEALAHVDAPQPPTRERKPRRSSRQLAIAMEAMSLRMLLTSLHRSVLTESPRRRQMLDNILVYLREECQYGLDSAQPSRAI